MQIPTLVFGKASIEIVMEAARAHQLAKQGHGEVKENVKGVVGLVWFRVEVYTITKSGGGYNFDFAYNGASTWLHANNIRNFELLPTKAA